MTSLYRYFVNFKHCFEEAILRILICIYTIPNTHYEASVNNIRGIKHAQRNKIDCLLRPHHNLYI